MTTKTETRKQDILKTAYECFTQFGYSKTSFEIIAQRAGISRPLLYQHFKNKEDLFTCMLEEHFENRYKLAEESLSSTLPPKEKLFQFVEILIFKDPSMLSNMTYGDQLFSELSRVLPKFQEKYRKKFIKMATTILGNEELAEVFRFSLNGLRSDNPSITTLRKRVKILIDCVCK